MKVRRVKSTFSLRQIQQGYDKRSPKVSTDSKPGLERHQRILLGQHVKGPHQACCLALATGWWIEELHWTTNRFNRSVNGFNMSERWKMIHITGPIYSFCKKAWLHFAKSIIAQLPCKCKSAWENCLVPEMGWCQPERSLQMQTPSHQRSFQH